MISGARRSRRVGGLAKIRGAPVGRQLKKQLNESLEVRRLVKWGNIRIGGRVVRVAFK